jgi:TP901 family phage tail tape measure protein
MGFDAEVGLDVGKAIKAARDLAGTLANLQNAVGGSSKELDKAERNAATAAAALQQYAKSGKAVTQSATQQATALRALVTQYNALNKAATAARANGKNAVASVLPGGSTVGETAKQYQAAEDARLAQARQTNAQIIKDEQKVRATQLAELRAAIQKRAEIEQVARAEIKKIHDGQAKDAAAAYQRQLAEARKTAKEISRVWEQAQAQNRQFDVNRLGQQVNAQSLRANLGSDLMASMRGTAEYTNLIDRSVQGLANQRYALYDVATTFGIIATATAGAGVAAVAMGASYEKAFAQVERTTLASGAELQQLHSDLIDISTTLPVAFQDVTSIATLGAQLNIANENLAGFTTTVSQFAATTDVTVERAAMGFGRLAQLTKTPQNEISNLGSAIYQTGINSVATEGEILSVAEQIATAGDLAGFSNTQIIALASSLASLGVAPEQARGAIMRIFGDITAAVGEGGEALQGFADMAGLSAQEFARLWRDSPQEAFTAYIEGAERVIQAQGDLDSALKNQGFINIRDRNVITRLANNTQVYADALHDTTQAYAENTALSEGAAIANDNLADKLTVLMNTIKALMAAAGQNEALNGLVDLLNRFLGGVLDFVQTPIGKVLATIVLGFGALVGAVAATVAGLAMGRASLLALVTAMETTARSTGRSTLNLRALTLELIRMGGAGPRAAAGLTAVSAAANAQGTALMRARAGMAAYSAATNSATAATSRFATVSRGALMATGLGAAFVAVTVAINEVTKAFQSAEDSAAEYFSSLPNGGTGLAEAIAQDTAAAREGGTVYREYTEWVGAAGARNADTADQIRQAAGAQTQAKEATEQTNAALDNQVRVLGDASKAWIANTLATDENFQKLWEQKDVLDALGFSLEEFIQRTLESPNGGNQYIQGLIDDFNELYATGKSGYESAGISLDEMALAVRDLKNITEAYQTTVDTTMTQEQIRTQILKTLGVALDEAENETRDNTDANEEYGNTLSDLVDKMFAATSATASVQDAVQRLGQSLGENGNSFSAFTEGGRENLEALETTISAMADAAGDNAVILASNVAGLMAELQAYGVDVGNELSFVGDTLNQLVGNQWGIDFNSAPARADIQAFINAAIAAIQMRANLERAAATARATALSAGGNSVAAALSSAAGVASSTIYQSQINALKAFQGQIKSATSSAGSLGKTLKNGFDAGRKAANGAGKAARGAGKDAGGAAKEFRTLVDYANDIESVWKRAFDIRYGPSQAADATASALQKMRDEIEANNRALTDARIRVQELNAELGTLRADNTTLGYQLGVAIEYGDELRANEIRAKMAENNEEIAKTEADKARAQKDAKKAQDAANLSLTGNSAAAINNREAVLGLIQSYQGQIQALASSGLSTAELARRTEALRQDFIRQLTQMGYNRSEVMRYTAAFDDLARVLRSVPRNVTVTANTNPAQQAINEFIARNNNRTVNMRVNTPSVGNIGAGKITPSGIAVGNGGITTPKVGVGSGGVTAPKMNIAGQVQYGGSARPVATGGYIDHLAVGGVAGLHPGAPTGTDTVPAWLTPGEFVQRKAAVDYYGIPFMNALNSLQIPRFFAQGGSAGGAVVKGSAPSVQLVELLPNQLHQLAQMVSTQVNLDGEKITTNVNSHNVQTNVRGGA